MAPGTGEGDDPLLRNPAHEWFRGHQVQAWFGLVDGEEFAVGITRWRGAVGALAPQHLTLAVAHPEGVDFRQTLALQGKQAFDIVVVQMSVAGIVLERVNDREQGEVDAPHGVIDVVFKQGREVGGAVAHLIDGAVTAVEQALEADAGPANWLPRSCGLIPCSSAMRRMAD